MKPIEKPKNLFFRTITTKIKLFLESLNTKFEEVKESSFIEKLKDKAQELTEN
ncbi:MAG: hypothetical protein IPF58_08070 [Saprospirales bacterium]|nr:hypothetical protein [Saprospirales bacterium]